MNVPELKANQMITIAYFIGIIVILFIVYKVLAGVGLVKTAAAKKVEAQKATAIEDLQTLDYWNPDYWTTSKSKLMDGAKAKDLSDKLFNAMAGLGTDEQTVYAVFGSLTNKTQISQLASFYKLNNGFLTGLTGSLQVDLLNELNDKEVLHLMQIVNKLPN
jgi:hypothetical protein